MNDTSERSVPYPAIHIIFTLLNAIRRGIESKNIWREFRRQKIALKPRLAFWITVCKQAGLLESRNGQLRVTRHARAWLNKTPEEQAICLIQSWQNAPKNKEVRRFRKKLTWKLKYDKPLTQKDRGALNGLEALGLVSKNGLTAWGDILVKGKGALPTPKPTAPCEIHQDIFIAPLPQQANLLWDIETYLRPIEPGKYPLRKRALSFHGKDPYALIALIEKGLRAEIPGRAKAIILGQPVIAVAQGIVLEFSNPADLAQLRRQPALRKYIEKFLSPQSALAASENAKPLMEMLKRRGVHLEQNEEPPGKKGKRTHFQRNPARGGSILQPLGKPAPLLSVLEKYKQLSQALDVLYRVPGQPPELRRITPLSIEQRGGHTYVIAYCQTRRGQRTFRLDRMETPGTV